LRTRPRGMTLPMTYRSSRSYQQRLPNAAAQSDAFRPALNAPTHSAPGRERYAATTAGSPLSASASKRR
jgi:hypothetical protein